MIFKVIVLGRNIALQTGFLCRVAGNNISTQLFNTLGVSLGVAKSERLEDTTVAIQLWALPQTERLSGLSANFTRGHRAAILVIRTDEIESITNLLDSFSIQNQSNLFITIIRSDEDSEFSLESLDRVLQEYQISAVQTLDDIIELISERLISKESSNHHPIVFLLDEGECPVFEPVEVNRQESTCSDADVDEIRSILLDQGLRVIEESCVIELDEGLFFISLRTGSVGFEPAICNVCLNDCKRKNNICIIAVDSGWSSQGIGQKALLTTAKAIAIAERSLPNHVEIQIQRACSCSRFLLDPSVQEQDLPMLLEFGIKEGDYSNKSLLDIARERYNQGRLSMSAFNMLKSRLESIRRLNKN